MLKHQSKAPWEKQAPKNVSHTKLTPADKKKAKEAARKANRVYPNLVDNMKVAAAKKRKKKRNRSGGAH